MSNNLGAGGIGAYTFHGGGTSDSYANGFVAGMANAKLMNCGGNGGNAEEILYKTKLRDEIAVKVMATFIGDGKIRGISSIRDYSALSYLIADTMMTERGVKNEPNTRI